MYAVVKLSGAAGDFNHVRKMRVFEDRDEANRLAEEWYLKLKKIDKGACSIDRFSVDFCGYIETYWGIMTIEVVKC